MNSSQLVGGLIFLLSGIAKGKQIISQFLTHFKCVTGLRFSWTF